MCDQIDSWSMHTILNCSDPQAVSEFDNMYMHVSDRVPRQHEPFCLQDGKCLQVWKLRERLAGKCFPCRILHGRGEMQTHLNWEGRIWPGKSMNHGSKACLKPEAVRLFFIAAFKDIAAKTSIRNFQKSSSKIRLRSDAHSTQLSPAVTCRDRQGGPATAPPGHRNYCSSCNAEIMPDARFCRMCGKKFEAHWSQGDWVMHV